MLQLLSRADCGLCGEFHAELLRFIEARALPTPEVVAVDSDPELARRYGLDIPVLLVDGIKVCQHRFDAHELWRVLRPR